MSLGELHMLISWVFVDSYVLGWHVKILCGYGIIQL